MAVQKQGVDTTETAADTTVKTVKRVSASLTAGDGDKAMRLTVMARRISGGRWETVVITTDSKGKNERGMTTRFDTFDAAAVSFSELVEDAVKKGWKKRERSGGFKAKPDAFNAIPKAPKK